MFQSRLLHVFRTDWRAANPLAIVTGAADGEGLAQAHRCADHGFDLLVADATSAIFHAGPALIRDANRVTTLRLDPDSVADADALLDAVGPRAVEALLVHGGGAAAGTRHLIGRVGASMRARENGRILVDGRALALHGA